jgi:thioredoxin 1
MKKRLLLLLMVSVVAANGFAQKKTIVQPPLKQKVTFIELGSVNCIPCKAMQPVMRAIETKYGNQVQVLFYDVWTPEQAPYAQKYGIRLIPTQVFLDENGKEFFRHEGFFAEEEIHKLLQLRGLKTLPEKKG